MKPAPDAGDDPLSRLDHMVGSAPEAENAVLTDNARLVRWTGPAFAAFSLLLLPWIGYIAVSLPSRQLSPNYDIAWAGFDVLLLAGLAATAYFALRRSRYLTTAASATATLLLVDAWFDCLTTPAARPRFSWARWSDGLPPPRASAGSRSCCVAWWNSRWRRCACGSAITRTRSPSAGSGSCSGSARCSGRDPARVAVYRFALSGHLGGRCFRFPRAETVMPSSPARVSLKSRRSWDNRAAQLLARAGLTSRG